MSWVPLRVVWCAIAYSWTIIVYERDRNCDGLEYSTNSWDLQGCRAVARLSALGGKEGAIENFLILRKICKNIKKFQKIFSLNFKEYLKTFTENLKKIIKFWEKFEKYLKIFTKFLKYFKIFFKSF